MDRSFPALFSRSNKDGTAQVLKQEAEDLGFEGKEILDYVKEQQKLDREERAEWRKIRMAELHAEDKKS